MGAIRQAFDLAFRDNNSPNVPATGFYYVKKSLVRALGTLIENALESGFGSLIIGDAVFSPTRANLYTKNPPIDPDSGGVAGVVYADPDPTLNGVYIHPTAGTGAANWQKADFTLPSTVMVSIAAMQAVVEAQALSITNLLNWASTPLTDVGGTAAAVTANAAGVTNAHQNGKIYQVIFPVALSATPTLKINSDGVVYELKDKNGDPLGASDVRTGSKHLVAGFGTHYRLLTSDLPKALADKWDKGTPINLGVAEIDEDDQDVTLYLIKSDLLSANPDQKGRFYTVEIPAANDKGSPVIQMAKADGTLIGTPLEIRIATNNKNIASGFMPTGVIFFTGNNGGYKLLSGSLVTATGGIDPDDLQAIVDQLADLFPTTAAFDQLKTVVEAAKQAFYDAAQEVNAAVDAGLSLAAPGYVGERGYATRMLVGSTAQAEGALVPADWVVHDPAIGSFIHFDHANASASPQVIAYPVAYPVEPGRTYLGVWLFRRTDEGSNDGGDTARALVQWMKGDWTPIAGGAGADRRVVWTGKPTVAQGWILVSKLFSFEGTGVDFTIPPTARAARVANELFGNTPETDIKILKWDDITASLAGGADVASLITRMAALEGVILTAQEAIDRVAELEAIIAGSATAPALDVRLRKIETDSFPSLGYFTPDATRAATSVARDPGGRLVEATFLSGLPLRRLKANVWTDNLRRKAAPSVGYLSPKVRAVSRVYLDKTGRPARAMLADGRTARVKPSGVWTVDGAAGRSSPSVGYLDAAPDSAAISTAFDRSGAVLSAVAAGIGAIGLEFLRAPGGLVRREAPVSNDGPIAVVTTATVTVPRARIRLAGGRWLYTRPATLACPAPASAAIVDEEIQAGVRYADAGWLAYQFIGAGTLAITRTSGAGSPAAVTIPAQASIDLNRGVVRGEDAGLGSYSATASYTGYKVRADIVSVNPLTGALTITLGDEVPRCAAIHTPAPPAGDRALFRIFSYRDGKEIIPLWPFEKRIRVDQRAAIEADVAKCQRRLRRSGVFDRILQRKIAGQPFVLALDGDSTSSRGNPPAGDPTGPNGRRDRIGYYQFYGSAEIAKIDTVDPGDGAGLMVREGPPWSLRRMLEARGLTVTYWNWAIAGTNLTATTGNQTDPARMARVAGDAAGGGDAAKKPDLLVFIPGQNDLGGAYVYERLTAYLAYMKTQGLPVIVGTPCRRNPFYGDAVTMRASWLQVCADIVRACEDAGVAYFDATRVLDTPNLGALGLSQLELSGASMQNHDEVFEQRARDDLLVELMSA